MSKHYIPPLDDKTNLLVNVSNYPSAQWRKEQQAGFTVVDVPFPYVPVGATTRMIEELVNNLLEKITDVCAGKRYVTIYVSGEHVAMFCLVTKLQAHGRRVVSALTERVVEEGEKGEKILTFKFMGWRTFPLVILSTHYTITLKEVK